MNTRNFFVALATLAIPAVAHASVSSQVPEPETLALLAIGAAAIAIARWRRNK